MGYNLKLSGGLPESDAQSLSTAKELRMNRLIACALFLSLLSTAAPAAPAASAVRAELLAAPGADDVHKGLDDQEMETLRRSAPKVFIDGYRIDMNFIRTAITFVNYVRDRNEADVHVLITQQGTGGGGREYTLAFLGQDSYAGLNNEIKFYSNRTETEDEVRKGLVQILKLGLAPYAARTPISKILSLDTERTIKPTAAGDAWDYWVFSVSARGRLMGEESYRYTGLNGNVSVNRVTPASKFRLGVSGSYDESRFDYEDYEETSTSSSRWLSGLYVRSLDDHWSSGATWSLGTSTYGNIATGFSLSPAVEFDVFPYDEATRRQLRILYRIGLTHNTYLEETVYDKLSETVFGQALAATLELTEPWGNAEISAEGSHLFNDFDFHRLRLSAWLSLRLLKGLSLTLDGRYAAVHDQIALRKSEVSLDDLLLRRKELATNYNYGLSVGFSFTFGSVYSNVVNPRFGGV